jgi:hypothetical protein
VYFSGFDPGYEETPYAGLYIPEINVDASVLLNVFEATAVTGDRGPPNVDVVDAEFEGSAPSEDALAELAGACGEHRDRVVRRKLDVLIQEHFRRYLGRQPRSLLERIATFTAPWRDDMPSDHLAIDDTLREVLADVTDRRVMRRRGISSARAPAGKLLS